jgi:hypothetical protein
MVGFEGVGCDVVGEGGGERRTAKATSVAETRVEGALEETRERRDGRNVPCLLWVRR